MEKYEKLDKGGLW